MATAPHNVDADAEAARQQRPAAPPKPAASPKRALAKADVTIVLFLIDRAEVRIGGKRITVEDRESVSISAGVHRVQWRASSDDPWHDAGRRTFVADRATMLRVRSSGQVEVVTLPDGERNGP